MYTEWHALNQPAFSSPAACTQVQKHLLSPSSNFPLTTMKSFCPCISLPLAETLWSKRWSFSTHSHQVSREKKRTRWERRKLISNTDCSLISNKTTIRFPQVSCGQSCYFLESLLLQSGIHCMLSSRYHWECGRTVRLWRACESANQRNHRPLFMQHWVLGISQRSA
jgi:hypothetical protein